jgi:putative flavoprotein involved in K+ transport
VAAGRFRFADDLAENLRFGDEVSAAAKRRIDTHISSAGIAAPLAAIDPAESVPPRLPDPPIRSLDPSAEGLSTVIWCTGFRGDYGWLKVPGALEADGWPLLVDGVSPVPGLSFAGLDFATSRCSGTILAIAEEGPRIASHLGAFLGSAA